MKTSEGGSVGLRSDLQMVKDVEGRVRTRLGRMIRDLKWEHYRERKHVYFSPGKGKCLQGVLIVADVKVENGDGARWKNTKIMTNLMGRS